MYRALVAVFHDETRENMIVEGKGLTPVESIVRAAEYRLSPGETQNFIQIYGPDDIGGLLEQYEERGIYLSDPILSKGESDEP